MATDPPAMGMTLSTPGRDLAGSLDGSGSRVAREPWLDRLVRLRRSPRVCLLVAAIIVLSVVDLYLTLMFLTHGGMLESNPLARIIINAGSPVALIGWKIGTVTLSAFILLRARRHGVAEIGAWVGLAVLCWLGGQWIGYVNHSRDLHLAAASLDDQYMHNATNGQWVSLAPGMLAP
ncbi:MAG: DUF5658 family protein [Planctomycetota bacterium]